MRCEQCLREDLSVQWHELYQKHLCDECIYRLDQKMEEENKQFEVALEKPGRIVDLRSKGQLETTIAVKPRDPNKTPWEDLMDRFRWVTNVISGLERADFALEEGIRKYIESHNEWTRRVDKDIANIMEILTEAKSLLARIENYYGKDLES